MPCPLITQPKTLGRGGQNETVRRCATVEVGNGVVGQLPVDRDHHGDWRVELTEAAHDPVLAACFVVSFDAHGLEELDGDLDLTIAMDALVPVIRHLDLAVDPGSGQHSFGVALPDRLERRPGDHVEVPRLRVHRGRRTFRDLDDLGQELLWHWFCGVPAGTASLRDERLEVHGRFLVVVVVPTSRPQIGSNPIVPASDCAHCLQQVVESADLETLA